MDSRGSYKVSASRVRVTVHFLLLLGSYHQLHFYLPLVARF